MRFLSVKKNVVTFLILYFCLTVSLFSQSYNRGVIKGRIFDSDTKAPLFGANVMLKGTLLGTACDQNGMFQIANLHPGTYQIEVTMIGFRKEVSEQIQVIPGQVTVIEVGMRATVIEQPTVVVTASKRKQYIEDAPTSVDIIGLYDIQARGLTTLEDVMQNTAGVGIIQGQVDLRGSSGFNWAAGSRVLMMVDGHPLIAGDTGSIPWDVIPVEEVERVEIVKGAGSALYGSNAMAGMINIITRDPSPELTLRYRLTWGFYDQPAYEAWRWTDHFLTYQLFRQGKLNLKDALTFEGIDLSLSKQLKKIGLVFKAGRKRSDGYQQNSDFSRWIFSQKLNWNLSPQQTVRLMWNLNLHNRGEFLQWVSQDHPLEVPEEELGNRVQSDKMGVRATYENAVSPNVMVTVKTNAFRNHWQNDYYDNQDYAINDRLSADVQLNILRGVHTMTFGTETIYHQTRSLFYGDHHTWDWAVYGEDEISFSPQWNLSLGSRYDFHRIIISSDNDIVDQQISPRASLVCRPGESTSIRLSGGHGFRAPSIAEVFANVRISGFQVVPNTDLTESERAWSYELGIRQVLEFRLYRGIPETSFWKNPLRWTKENLNPGFVLDLALFGSHYRNMIDVNLNPQLMAFQFVNIGKARIWGVELRIMGSAFQKHLNLNFGYTYIDPLDINLDKTLTYRSRHRLVSGCELRLGRITFGMDYRYASRMEEVVNIFALDERVPVHVFDGRITYHMNKMQICIEGRNLRNYHYVLRQRFLEPVRHFLVTLRGEI